MNNSLFKQKEYESFKRVNTLPFRSHYIPFAINDEFKFKNGIIDKYSSSLLIPLNGKWLFKEHKCFSNLDKIDEELIDTININTRPREKD